jgi:hypothetical protein
MTLTGDSEINTIANKKALRKDCIKKHGVYYKINEDIFKIDGEWYTKDATIMDNFTKQNISITNIRNLYTVYDLKGDLVKTSNYVSMIEVSNRVSSASNDEFILGNSLFIRKICASEINKLIPADDFISGWNLRLDRGEYYVNPELYTYLLKTRHRAIRKEDNRIYNCQQSPDWNLLIKKGLSATDKFEVLKSALSRYTIGVEIETSDGNLPSNFHRDNGFIKLYDGSIPGHEYASVPFTYRNLGCLENFCNILKNTHTTDSSCSVHIHIGGVPFSEKNLVCIYLLFHRLEKEIHQLVSPYKKKIEFLGKKGKDHCQYLNLLLGSDQPHDDLKKHPDYISNLLQQIYDLHLSELSLSPKDFRTSKANEYLNNVHKWNMHGRYYFVNFLNYILRPEGTIELRLLQGTFNFDRILNWLLINVSIIRYAMENQDKILIGRDKIYLQDCIEYSHTDNVKDTLLSFVEEVKANHHNANVTNNLQLNTDYFTAAHDRINSKIKF